MDLRGGTARLTDRNEAAGNLRQVIVRRRHAGGATLACAGETR